METARGSGSRVAAVALVILLAVAVMSSAPTAADAGKDGAEEKHQHGGEEKHPEFVERALGLEGLRSRWDAAVSWAKLKILELQKRPAVVSGPDRTHRLKDAVADSVGAGTEAAEKSARTAAEAVERTVHMAKEKVDEVKKKAHIPGTSHAEL